MRPIQEASTCQPASDRRSMRSSSALVIANLRHRLGGFFFSPLAAIAVAVPVLALVLEPERGLRAFAGRKSRAVDAAAAADISLHRLVRSRVSDRLRRQNRDAISLEAHSELVEAELRRIGQNPLYLRIQEMMRSDLASEGFERVSVQPLVNTNYCMLANECEISINTFLHSLRASVTAPNEQVAAFLNEHETQFGKSIVYRRGRNRFDMTLTFLIQVLFEFPDECERVAQSIRFTQNRPESSEIPYEFAWRP
jgi:hypothetical protein